MRRVQQILRFIIHVFGLLTAHPKFVRDDEKKKKRGVTVVGSLGILSKKKRNYYIFFSLL